MFWLKNKKINFLVHTLNERSALEGLHFSMIIFFLLLWHLPFYDIYYGVLYPFIFNAFGLIVFAWFLFEESIYRSVVNVLKFRTLISFCFQIKCCRLSGLEFTKCLSE